MKRFLSALIAVVLIFAFCSAPFAYADNRDLIVYIASGSSSAYRYHARASCSSLSRSTIEALTLEEAAQRGFTPCQRCHPPAPDFDVSATPRPKSGSSSGYTPRQTASPTASPAPPVTRSSAAATQRNATIHTSKGRSANPLLFLAGAASAVVVMTVKKKKE